MNNFSLWFQITELYDIWKGCIAALKCKNASKINESNYDLNRELEYWNHSFDELFQTSGVKWVNLALSAGVRHGYTLDRDSEHYATAMGETLTDLYMCFSTGTNPMTRKVERGIDDQSINSCPSARRDFLTVMQPDKTQDDKMRLFTKSVATRLENRSQAIAARSKPIRGSRSSQSVDYDDYISKTSDPALIKKGKTDSGTVLGSGRVLQGDDDIENNTIGDEGTTFMNLVKEKIRAMKGRQDDKKPEAAISVLDSLFAQMQQTGETPELSQNYVGETLGVPPASAARILRMIRVASEQAKEELGLLSGFSAHLVSKPGAGRRRVGA